MNNNKKADRDKLRFKFKSTYTMLTACLAGMITCMVLLAGTTWAWYQCTITARINSIILAKFNINVQVASDEGVPVVPSGIADCDPFALTDTAKNPSQSFSLEKGKKYTVTITAVATPQTSGYCVLSGFGIDHALVQYTTVNITNGELLKFDLIPEFDGQFSFSSIMGTSYKYPDISFGAVIGKITNNGDSIEDDTKTDNEPENGEANSNEPSENNPDSSNNDDNRTEQESSGSSTGDNPPENLVGDSSNDNKPNAPEQPPEQPIE